MTFERAFALIGAAGVSFCLSASFLPAAKAFVRWQLDRQERKRALAGILRDSMQVVDGRAER
ncbi:MAG TPA: hypothetical protein VLV16_07440 [Gemmatimonadales bacterium]|nr:hypothetical protein [Gemmatimonadales bacterium]